MTPRSPTFRGNHDPHRAHANRPRGVACPRSTTRPSHPGFVYPEPARFQAGRAALAAVGLAGAVLAGCSGEVVFEPEDTVTAGEALGFDFITYTVSDADATSIEIIEITDDGRAIYRIAGRGRGSTLEPIRFLRDDELLALRTDFNDSDFFFWADSTFGEPAAGVPKQTIIFQFEGRSDDLVRYGDAPVPPEIEVLFAQLEPLLAASKQFGEGNQLAVRALVEGRHTRIARREFSVIRSRDELINLLWRVGSLDATAFARVDFATEMVVGVFFGDDAMQTDTLTFADVAYQLDGAVNVLFRRTDMAEGCDAPASRPFAMARVPRAPGRVQFFEDPERETRACAP